MNNLERFKAVANFEATDYIPVFGFPGAPGMSRGCMKFTRADFGESDRVFRSLLTSVGA